MPSRDVDGDDDPGAERGDDVVEEVDVAERRRADDRALGAGAQRVADGGAPCAGRRRTGRGRRSRWTIRRRWSSDCGAPERAPSRSTTCRKRAPASTHDLRGLERVVVVGRRVLEAALDEPHRLAVHDVDRRVEDHATATAASRAKLRSRRSPSREDFSGWNCAAITLPRSTTETKRSPYSLVPTHVGRVARAGRRTSARGRRPRRRRGPRCSCDSRSNGHEVPADVRQPRAVQPRDRRRAGCPARRRPRARWRTRTAAACRGRCRAAAARERLVSTSPSPVRVEVAHRLRERADAGQDHGVARRGSRRGRR